MHSPVTKHTQHQFDYARRPVMGLTQCLKHIVLQSGIITAKLTITFESQYNHHRKDDHSWFLLQTLHWRCIWGRSSHGPAMCEAGELWMSVPRCLPWPSPAVMCVDSSSHVHHARPARSVGGSPADPCPDACTHIIKAMTFTLIWVICSSKDSA